MRPDHCFHATILAAVLVCGCAGCGDHPTEEPRAEAAAPPAGGGGADHAPATAPDAAAESDADAAPADRPRPDQASADANADADAEPADRPDVPGLDGTEITIRPHEGLRDELKPIFGYIARSRPGIARIRLRKHEAEHGEDYQTAFLYALTYHREKNYARAREHFERSLRLDPGYAVAWYFYGWTLFYLGELDLAEQAFQYNLIGQPENGDAHFGLGLIAMERGELDDAEQQFTTAIAKFTADGEPADIAKAYARLGDAKYQQDEFEAAKQHLETAVQIYPDHYEALFSLHRVLMRLGETERAEEVFRQYEETRQRLRPTPDAHIEPSPPPAPAARE